MVRTSATSEGVVPGKKYRLGNQNKEYELITSYLGWSPEHTDWESFIFTPKLNKKEFEVLTILSPDKKEKIELLMDHAIVKDAFPLSFFGEERSKNWLHFYIVATTINPDVRFIIPLH